MKNEINYKDETAHLGSEWQKFWWGIYWPIVVIIVRHNSKRRFEGAPLWVLLPFFNPKEVEQMNGTLLSLIPQAKAEFKHRERLIAALEEEVNSMIEELTVEQAESLYQSFVARFQDIIMGRVPTYP